MRTRPRLYTSYASEMALIPTWTQKITALVFLTFLVLIPFGVIPGVGFLSDNDWLKILSRVSIFAIGALGLHILSGLAGQVSLGHAFFVGIGSYTAAILGGEVGKGTWGLGLPIWIWLPAAGIVAALVGALIAPTAVRVRGIYLAIVTLGLVFVGEWLFRSLPFITGGAQTGPDRETRYLAHVPEHRTVRPHDRAREHRSRPPCPYEDIVVGRGDVDRTCEEGGALESGGCRGHHRSA